MEFLILENLSKVERFRKKLWWKRKKPVITEKVEFKFRDESKLIANFGLLDYEVFETSFEAKNFDQFFLRINKVIDSDLDGRIQDYSYGEKGV